MNYAENNRISHRQLYRQIILTFAAPLLLCLPGRGGVQGISGIVGTGIAVLLLLLYVFFLMRTVYGYSDLVRYLGRTAGGLVALFFLIYLVMTGIYLLALIEEIIPVWLVSGINGKWLTFAAVLACSYGMHKGMQKRGRMAEVTGGVFLFLIFVMILLLLGQAKMTYLNEMVQNSAKDGKVVAGSTYEVLCAFSGVGLLPFVMKDVEKKESAGRTVMAALLITGGIILAMLILLPAILGWKRTGEEAYPVLPLLAGADLPGNVLARFDVLWMGILLYGILFTLGSVFYYGNQIMNSIHLREGRFWTVLLVYLGSFVRIAGRPVVDYYVGYLEKIWVPGLILLQILLLLRGQQKRKKKLAATVSIFVVLVLGLSGCAGIEPEKRMYPLAMGIDLVEGESSGEPEYSIVYGMPDLPDATGQSKDESEKKASVLTLRGKSFKDIESLYGRSQEKYLDIGHLQAVIVGKNLLASEKWEEFLAYLKQDPLAGENIYLFQTADPKAVIEWDTGGTSVGEYLTGLMENRLSTRQRNGVTLREVYYQWYQERTMRTLPEIILKNDGIQVYLE